MLYSCQIFQRSSLLGAEDVLEPCAPGLLIFDLGQLDIVSEADSVLLLFPFKFFRTTLVIVGDIKRLLVLFAALLVGQGAHDFGLGMRRHGDLTACNIDVSKRVRLDGLRGHACLVAGTLDHLLICYSLGSCVKRILQQSLL